MKNQKEYRFKHMINSCILITIKAYSESEARIMLSSYVKQSEMYFLLHFKEDGCKSK